MCEEGGGRSVRERVRFKIKAYRHAIMFVWFGWQVGFDRWIDTVYVVVAAVRLYIVDQTSRR